MQSSGHARKLLVLLLVLAGGGWIWSRQLSNRAFPPTGSTAELQHSRQSGQLGEFDGSTGFLKHQDATTATKSRQPVPVRPPTQALLQDQEILKTLYGTGRIVDLLRTVQTNGGSDSALFSDFVGAAASTCGELLQKALSDPVVAADEVRKWAITGLVQACEGFDHKQFNLRSGADLSPSELFDNFGKEAGTEAAIKVVTNARDHFSLFDAGRVLVLADGFPPSLNASTRSLGTPEKIRAWSSAVQLFQCNLAGGCGPLSFQTLSFCAHAGCRRDSDYRSALSQYLRPDEYTAMLAYLNWIERLKRSG